MAAAVTLSQGRNRGAIAYRPEPCERPSCTWPEGTRWERRTGSRVEVERVELRHAERHRRGGVRRDQGGRSSWGVTAAARLAERSRREASE